MLPFNWSALNLLAWTFGLYAVYGLRAEFDRRARTWMLMTWAIWPCLLMELAMAGIPYVPGSDLFSAFTGISSGVFLWLAFASLRRDVDTESLQLLRWHHRDWVYGLAYLAVAIGTVAVTVAAPTAAQTLMTLIHPVEGAVWLIVPAALAAALFAIRLSPGHMGLYTPSAFALAFAFAFAHAALAPVAWITGLAIVPTVGWLFGTLFILTLVIALYGLVLRVRAHKLAEAMARLHSLQEQLFGVEKVAAVSTLAAGAAHEFNNYLTTILGYAQLALQDPSVPPQPRADLRAIETAANAAASVVQDLLGVARRPKAVQQFTDLSGAVRAPLVSLSQEFERRNIRIITRLDSAVTPAVDLDLVHQVCLNLYLNARDAMLPKGGGTLEVHVREVDGQLEVAVKDTGVGIPIAFRSRIFQPLQTTKGDRGTGLGLSVSRSLIQSMGGDITFESAEGEGTTFLVRLPLGASRHSVREAAPTQAVGASGTAALAQGLERGSMPADSGGRQWPGFVGKETRSGGRA